MNLCNFQSCDWPAKYVTDDPFNPGQKKYACQEHYDGIMHSLRYASSNMPIEHLPKQDYPQLEEILKHKPDWR